MGLVNPCARMSVLRKVLSLSSYPRLYFAFWSLTYGMVHGEVIFNRAPLLFPLACNRDQCNVLFVIYVNMTVT